MTYYYVVDEVSHVITGPIELPEIPGFGIQVPGNVIELESLLPPAESSHVWVWQNGTTVQLLDLRNRFVYRKIDGGYVYWTQLGPIPDDLTTLPYPGRYYVWGVDDWALDLEAQCAGKSAEASVERDNRLRVVVIRVAPLQYAYELGEADSDQATQLQAWKRYAVNLLKIEQQTGFPLSIDWPQAPEKYLVAPSA